MNLYIISRKDSISWDEYIAAVVCAENEEEAKKIHPSGDNNRWNSNDNWVTIESVSVKKIGIADQEIKKGVVFNAFNAG